VAFSDKEYSDYIDKIAITLTHIKLLEIQDELRKRILDSDLADDWKFNNLMRALKSREISLKHK